MKNSKKPKKTVGAQPQFGKARSGAYVPENKSRESNLFISALCLIYALLAITGAFHHEMWRDEIQTWLVGKSSGSFSEFIRNMRHESNPLLWYTANFFISRLSGDPWAAQVFHVLISCGTVFIFTKYAPLSKIQKILFSFGYFILFEYGIIARGYGLTVFFFFLFCALFSTRHPRKYLLLGVVLLLLSNATGAHGIILSLSLIIAMLVDYVYSKDPALRRTFSSGQVLLGTSLAVFGLWLAMKFISPPSDSDRANMWFMEYDGTRFFSNLRSVVSGFFPIVDPGSLTFWNTNVLVGTSPGTWNDLVIPCISLAGVFYFMIVFSKNLAAFVFYGMATIGVLMFSYLNQTIYILFAARYYGFLFLALIGAAWFLYSIAPARVSVPVFNKLRVKMGLDRHFPVVLTMLLSVNAVGGLLAYAKDFVLSFSNVRSAGEYLVEKRLIDKPMTGFTDYAVSPLSAFTEKPIYYPDRDTSGTFVIWTTKNYTTDGNQIVSRMINFINKVNDTSVVLLNFDLNTTTIGDINFLHLASFKDAVVKDENYSIYLASKFNLETDLKSTAVPLTDDRIRNYIGIGVNLLQQNKTDDCERIIGKIKEKAEENMIPRFHNLMGMLHAKKNLLNEAKMEFQKEIDLNLNAEEAYFQLGMLHYQDQKMDSALYCWEEVLKINPNNVDAVSNAAVVYFNFRKDMNKARALWEKGVSINPRYTQLYVNLMMICQNKNDEDCKIKYLKGALSNGITVDEIKSKGITISDQLLSKLR